MSDWFCTVFPNDPSEMPQDFPSYEAAKMKCSVRATTPSKAPAD